MARRTGFRRMNDSGSWSTIEEALRSSDFIGSGAHGSNRSLSASREAGQINSVLSTTSEVELYLSYDSSSGLPWCNCRSARDPHSLDLMVKRGRKTTLLLCGREGHEDHNGRLQEDSSFLSSESHDRGTGSRRIRRGYRTGQ